MTRRTSFALVFALVLSLPAAAQLHTFRPPLTPQSLWDQLHTGNQRYVTGRLVYNGLDKRRKATRLDQNPPVSILACADSRVPPELIFDRTVGDLFISRVAGNVTDTFDLASLEYAVHNRYTKLILVMGHEDCGAVKAALDGGAAPSPHIGELVERIQLATRGFRRDQLREATIANVRYTMKYLVDNSDMIRKAVAENRVEIRGAFYEFDGHVHIVTPQ